MWLTNNAWIGLLLLIRKYNRCRVEAFTTVFSYTETKVTHRLQTTVYRVSGVYNYQIIPPSQWNIKVSKHRKLHNHLLLQVSRAAIWDNVPTSVGALITRNATSQPTKWCWAVYNSCCCTSQVEYWTKLLAVFTVITCINHTNSWNIRTWYMCSITTSSRRQRKNSEELNSTPHAT